MVAHLFVTNLTAGIHEDDRTTSRKQSLDVTSHCHERVMRYRFEIGGRMLDDLQTALRVPLLEPLLKWRSVTTFGGVFECAAERVERELAETVRFTPEQRYDTGCRTPG